MSTFRMEIEAAFPPLPAPPNEEIVHQTAFLDLEREEIRRAFANTVWSELAPDLLRYHAEALFFFTPRAWAYFLPAYMSATLDDFVASDLIPTAIVSTVLGDESRLHVLTRGQQVVLSNFLKWLDKAHSEDFIGEDLSQAVATVNQEVSKVSSDEILDLDQRGSGEYDA